MDFDGVLMDFGRILQDFFHFVVVVVVIPQLMR